MSKGNGTSEKSSLAKSTAAVFYWKRIGNCSLYAVRPGLDETLRCEKARQALANSELVLHIEDADVQLFKLPDNSDIPQCKALLRELPDVRFAGSALVDPHTQEPVFYTENIFLKFVDRLAPTECLVILDELGLTIKQQVPTPQCLLRPSRALSRH
jgi:hypothetical protein